MIKGMTGFGSATFAAGKVKGVIEIRSLNHRYLDLNFYLPNGFASSEEKIRQIISKSFHRGRVTVAIKITSKPEQKFSFNKDAIEQYLKYAKSLKRRYHLKGDLLLSEVIRLPGVVESSDTMVSVEAIWLAVSSGLKKAINGLVNMRKREGRSLMASVNDQLKRMKIRIQKIQSRSKILLRDNKKKLTDDEFLSFQKGSDVNEEISRMIHYVDEIKALLKINAPAGKKLDFIAQEMQRETNTIGSKLQDKVVSNAVIALKGKIEKIREQAQNIE